MYNCTAAISVFFLRRSQRHATEYPFCSLSSHVQQRRHEPHGDRIRHGRDRGGTAAQGGAGVEEERNSPEVMSGDLSMGPTPDATVATPSATGAASAEGTTPFGAYPLSAELAQVLEGLTPEEDANRDSAQRGDASRTPPRRGRGRPKVHSAPAALRSAQSARGRPRREDENVQERQQRRRREESASSQRSGPVPRDEEEILLRQLQRRQSMRGEAQERGPVPRDEEEILLRQLQRRQSMRGEAQERGPVPRDEEDLEERQQRRRREMVGLTGPGGPVPRDEEELLLRQLRRRRSMRGELQERGPVPRDEEENLEEATAERGEA